MQAVIEWQQRIRAQHPNCIIVATNGCFDLLHVGHLQLLSSAKSFGDFLVVGINSDAAVKALKGEGRPANSQENRQAILRAIRFVDEAFIFDSTDASDFLRSAHPDIYVKAEDYNLMTLDTKELTTLRAVGSIIRFVPLVSGVSTTKIIEKVRTS